MNKENLAKLISAYDTWLHPIRWNSCDCIAAMIQRIKYPGRWKDDECVSEGVALGTIQAFLEVSEKITRHLFYMTDEKDHTTYINTLQELPLRDQRYIITNALGRLGLHDGAKIMWIMNLRALGGDGDEQGKL